MKPTRIAGTRHTALLLAIIFALSTRSAVFVGQETVTDGGGRLFVYARTAVGWWLVTAFTVWGVQREGLPLSSVLGPPWRSVRQVLRDIGIAMLFWVSVTVLLGFSARALGLDTRGVARFLYPKGSLESIAWVSLSVSAGFCEELVFRGYLQRQLAALTGSVASGIVLSALIFGACHLYQGLVSASLLCFYGAALSLLAHRRQSVRSGMIAHAWQDIFVGIVGGLVRTQ